MPGIIAGGGEKGLGEAALLLVDGDDVVVMWMSQARVGGQGGAAGGQDGEMRGPKIRTTHSSGEERS